MNDIYITLVGNVAADPRQYQLNDGSRVTSLRLASTRRVFDRPSQTWHDGETTFYAVRCYRALAENVARSIKLGQPIVVHGKLRIRSYERDGERRFMAEVEATSVGHDLRRGVSSFERPQRGVTAPVFDEMAREQLANSTRDWELGGGRGVPALVPGDPAGPSDLPSGELSGRSDLVLGDATGANSPRGAGDGWGGADLDTQGAAGGDLTHEAAEVADLAYVRTAEDSGSRLGVEPASDTEEGSADVGSWQAQEAVEPLAA
ncbi:single-stranded DNA-binding protein [Sphaerisporangium perillae]|uniref:single-stranded DNA-binding protein n=1 Tax=Sphaerisporangium perillae TaxID=2935860 RepID=UPI00200ECBCF|nr:single-stranded DNA-binding protein [Sphaerisporangium perillae]